MTEQEITLTVPIVSLAFQLGLETRFMRGTNGTLLVALGPASPHWQTADRIASDLVDISQKRVLAHRDRVDILNKEINRISSQTEDLKNLVEKHYA